MSFAGSWLAGCLVHRWKHRARNLNFESSASDRYWHFTTAGISPKQSSAALNYWPQSGHSRLCPYTIKTSASTVKATLVVGYAIRFI